MCILNVVLLVELQICNIVYFQTTMLTKCLCFFIPVHALNLHRHRQMRPEYEFELTHMFFVILRKQLQPDCFCWIININSQIDSLLL